MQTETRLKRKAKKLDVCMIILINPDIHRDEGIGPR